VSPTGCLGQVVLEVGIRQRDGKDQRVQGPKAAGDGKKSIPAERAMRKGARRGEGEKKKIRSQELLQHKNLWDGGKKRSIISVAGKEKRNHSQTE